VSPEDTGQWRAQMVESARSLRDAIRTGSRILVVEDDPLVSRSLARSLRHFGHLVDTAATIKAAKALRGAWDIGVFDYSLPDGLTSGLARALQEEGRVGVVVSFSGTPRDAAPYGDHVINKNDGVKHVVALVAELAAG
jgi:CheY-like chemotaxis protein